MKEFLLAFIPIFVAVDAIGLVPILAALTRECDAQTKRRIAFESTVTALALSLGFMFAGQAIFNFLGISVGDFMIAGGLILFCIALKDILSLQKSRRLPVTELAAVPIGTPLIAGPALLTTSLMLASQYGFVLTGMCLVINILLASAAFLASDALLGKFGLSGVRAFSKVISLLLAAIAIMMIRKGIGLVLHM